MSWKLKSKFVYMEICHYIFLYVIVTMGYQHFEIKLKGEKFLQDRFNRCTYVHTCMYMYMYVAAESGKLSREQKLIENHCDELIDND
jgi:hypothetical protein